MSTPEATATTYHLLRQQLQQQEADLAAATPDAQAPAAAKVAATAQALLDFEAAISQAGPVIEATPTQQPWCAHLPPVKPQPQQRLTFPQRLRALWCCLWFGVLPWWLYEAECHHRPWGYWQHLWNNLLYAVALLLGRETPIDIHFELSTNKPRK